MYFSKLTSFAAVLAISSMLAQAVPTFDVADLEVRNSDEVQIEARWGTGKYKVDDAIYHSSVKPEILKEFRGKFSNFASKCGSNPNFIIDKGGDVYPEPQKKNAKACPKSKFTLNLGSEIESIIKDVGGILKE